LKRLKGPRPLEVMTGREKENKRPGLWECDKTNLRGRRRVRAHRVDEGKFNKSETSRLPKEPNVSSCLYKGEKEKKKRVLGVLHLYNRLEGKGKKGDEGWSRQRELGENRKRNDNHLL